jgi:hypothetical protein
MPTRTDTFPFRNEGVALSAGAVKKNTPLARGSKRGKVLKKWPGKAELLRIISGEEMNPNKRCAC